MATRAATVIAVLVLAHPLGAQSPAVAPSARLSVTVSGERSLIVEAEFPALPASLDGEPITMSVEGMQRGTAAGVNLPEFTRELGIAATRVEILSVETLEQSVSGVHLSSLVDVPQTGDSARDRAMALRLLAMPSSVSPESWASLELAGRLGDRPVSVLSMRPYRYDAARGVVVAARRIRLRIDASEPLDGSAAASLAPAFRTRPAKDARASMLSVASSPTTAPDGFEYKIYTDRDGVYRLSPEMLRDAGIPIDAIDARTIKLYADGIEQPLLVVDRGNHRIDADEFNREYVEFFGERRRARRLDHGSDVYFDPYAKNSVYFLTWGGGLGKRIVEESGVVQSERIDPAGDLTGSGSSFLSTVHLEKDEIDVLLANVELNTLSDRFDRRMWGRVPPNEMKTFPVVLPHPNVLSQRPVEVRTAIRSSLRNSERLDAVEATHGVELYVDGFRTITAQVPSVGLAMLNNRDNIAEPLTAGKLRTDQQNVIALANRRGSGRDELSDSYLNWVDITYPRLYRANDDSIDFAAPPQFGARYATFRVRGFTSPQIRVYRRGISRVSNVAIVAGRTTESDTSYDVQFQLYVASEAERFYATTEANVLRPTILRDTPSDLLSSSSSADYVILVDEVNSDLATIDDERNPLRRFMAHKREAGFTPKLVRVADIYDELNGGVVSPFAIRRFLAHAWRTWSTPPRFALIFGSGRPIAPGKLTWIDESRRELMSERSYVPTIMLQTVLYGATECDYLLGCVDGEAPVRTNLLEGIRTTVTDDLIAEIAVGRVPITGALDIGAYVDKLIDQQRNADNGEWRDRSLHIGGWEELQGQQLMQVTNDYFRHVSEPKRFIASKSFEGTRYEYSENRSILGLLNEGVGVVTYLGHGGGGQWEESAELNLSNAASLTNRGRMGTVLSMTCFTGAYDVAGGLLGRLMIAPGGGAIQAFGTPGFGWLRNNGLLTNAVYSVMHNPRYRELSFGEIITLGKALYVGTHLRTFPDHVPTVAAMYAIFGDPSLRPPYAIDTVAVVADVATIAGGARLEASARLPFVPTGVVAHLFDTTETRIDGITVDVRRTGDAVSLSASVPSGYAQPFVGIRVYANDDRGRSVSGALRVPTDGSSVSIVRPAQPLVVGNDAVFEIEHSSSTALDSVKLTLRNDGGSVFDSVATAVASVGPRLYRTTPIPAAQIAPGSIIDVRLPGTTTAGPLMRTFVVEGGPDPAAFAATAIDSARPLYGPRARLVLGQAINPTIAMGATASGPRLLATAYNWGDRPAVDVPWRIEFDSAGLPSLLGSGLVTIAATGSTTIAVDIGPRLPFARNVRLILDRNGSDRWVDGYRDNNTAYHATPLSAGMVRSGVGFTVDGSTAAQYVVPDILAISMAAADARADGTVATMLDSIAPVSAQRWTAIPIGTPTTSAPVVRLIPRGIDATTPVTLSLTASGLATLPDDARIVRYDSTTRLWIVEPTTTSAGTAVATATVSAGGVYALMRVSDNVGPRIRFSVEGQFYLDSSAVPADARFSAVLFDESGIDTRGLSATLDGEPLELGRDIVWLDSTITASSGSVRVQKPVAGGTHSLCVTAADRAGNVRSECTTFEVDGELSVRLYGNFPNPFTSETFLAYEIRGASVVDNVELKIFSTSGRLVRTFRFPSREAKESVGLFSGGTGEPTSIGYHEAWWDGRDDQGRDVANGVYFYRLRVSTEDREIEELGTMARIR